MRFSDLAKSALVQTDEAFGAYVYMGKGPENVLNIEHLLTPLKSLSSEEAKVELKHLATRQDCPLDPTLLVDALLSRLDGDKKYSTLFSDETISGCFI